MITHPCSLGFDVMKGFAKPYSFKPLKYYTDSFDLGACAISMHCEQRDASSRTRHPLVRSALVRRVIHLWKSWLTCRRSPFLEDWAHSKACLLGTLSGEPICQCQKKERGYFCSTLPFPTSA